MLSEYKGLLQINFDKKGLLMYKIPIDLSYICVRYRQMF